VTEHRLRRSLEIVGSWVEIRIRAPRWRCSLTVERRVSVKLRASIESFIYWMLSAAMNETKLMLTTNLMSLIKSDYSANFCVLLHEDSKAYIEEGASRVR
jgi:hypothetical protein